jgi:hypothetical protein
MKEILITAVAATLALAPAVLAQDLAEYTSLATKTTTSPGTPRTPRMDARNGATKTADVSDHSGRDVAPHEKNTRATNQPVSNPASPAIFILCNGERLESDHYLLTVDSLRVQQGGTEQKIPLSAVNLDATIAANHARGMDLKIPKNEGQITLGF